MRIDKYLFEKNYFASRQSAKDHIDAGLVLVNECADFKPSYDVCEGDEIRVIGKLHEFVSRGGLKLKGALEIFKIDPTGAVAVDIGSSTGGFTDCLLQHGAKTVYSVDSGRDQLAQKLREDSRVRCYESMNARYLTKQTFQTEFDMAVMDVSFISQTLLYHSVCELLKENGIFISLIKPQFEVGKRHIGKGGIVIKNKQVFSDMFLNICDKAYENSLICKMISPSVIQGKDGNVEYIGYFMKSSEAEKIYPDFPVV